MSDFVTEAEALAADRQFAALTANVNLDKKLRAHPAMAARFERVLGRAIPCAYRSEPTIEAAHRFVQRALYRVNRLGLFWYDDLRRYSNERSPYLLAVRERLEREWQDWEARSLDLPALRRVDAPLALRARVRAGVPPSAATRYVAESMSVAGYRRLVQIAALDGLVETSQLSRTLAGAANDVHATLTRVLVEEYGSRRLARKPGSFYAAMLEALGLSTEPEAFIELMPWEVLAVLNHSFLLADRKRHFLRHVGSLLYLETSTGAVALACRTAARRLGLPAAACAYWDGHVREDNRQARWMLEGVALPLAARYPSDAWELVLGFDQQQRMSERGLSAIAREARDADQVATLRAAA